MTAAADSAAVLDALYATLIARREADPAKSYAASLFAKGPDAILKKIGEEADETIIAAKNLAPPYKDSQARDALVHEVADLWFHTLVLLAAYDLPVSAVTEELAQRTGRSGHDEKASRGPAA